MDARLSLPENEVAVDVTPAADRRVRALREILATGQHDVLSLDVFDTLVWRKALRPTDVFFQLAERLRARGALWPDTPAESFVQQRMRAERLARRATPGGEPTLEGIHAHFPKAFLRGITAAQLAQLEFELERENVRPHEELLALAREVQARGRRVALVSDTYFTAEQVRTLTGFAADAVVVSCEHGRCKAQGLHTVLLRDLAVDAARVLHVGDNEDADVLGPRPLGIDAYWFRRWPQDWAEPIAAEVTDVLSRRAPLVGADDAGLTALRSQILHSCEDPYEQWGGAVLGPVLSGYADWVRARCAEQGIRHVLCLMREGRVLKQVLDAQGDELWTRECFVSRYVARRAAILEASEDELLAFVNRPSAQRQGRLLEQLGLARDAFGGDPDQSVLPEQLRAFVRRIVADRGLRARVRETAAEVRRRLVKHIRSLLPKNARGPIAVVDLGYSGTIQLGLERVLRHERTGLTTHGLYLVTGADVDRLQAEGAPAEGYLAANGQPVSIAHTFMRSPEVFEQSLMADCGTTLGHEADGTPQLGVQVVPAAQRAAISAIQSGLLRWVAAWRQHRERHGVRDSAALQRLHRAIAVRAVARPSALELELFGAWQHDENFGSEVTRGLIEPVGLDAMQRSHLSAHQLASLPSAQLYWPFGCAAHESHALGEAVAHIYLRDVAPEVFDEGPGQTPLAVYWDSGDGFHAEQARVEMAPLGFRGRAWRRFRFRLEDATHHGYGVSLGLAGQWVRLDEVRVTRTAETGERELECYRAEDLESVGYRCVEGSLHEVQEGPPLWRVPGHVTPFTGVVDIDVFVAWMEAA